MYVDTVRSPAGFLSLIHEVLKLVWSIYKCGVDLTLKTKGCCMLIWKQFTRPGQIHALLYILGSLVYKINTLYSIKRVSEVKQWVISLFTQGKLSPCIYSLNSCKSLCSQLIQSMP